MIAADCDGSLRSDSGGIVHHHATSFTSDWDFSQRQGMRMDFPYRRAGITPSAINFETVAGAKFRNVAACGSLANSPFGSLCISVSLITCTSHSRPNISSRLLEFRANMRRNIEERKWFNQCCSVVLCVTQ